MLSVKRNAVSSPPVLCQICSLSLSATTPVQRASFLTRKSCRPRLVAKVVDFLMFGFFGFILGVTNLVDCAQNPRAKLRNDVHKNRASNSALNGILVQISGFLYSIILPASTNASCIYHYHCHKELDLQNLESEIYLNSCLGNI